MPTYPPYVHVYYPAARYHRTLPPVQVADPAEDDALGEGWEATPAAFCPHAEYAQPGDAHCPRCALALPDRGNEPTPTLSLDKPGSGLAPVVTFDATPDTVAPEVATEPATKNKRRR